MRWHFWGGMICCHKTRRDQVALFGIVSASGVITCSFIDHFHKAPSVRLVHQLFYVMILSVEKKFKLFHVLRVFVVFHKMFSFLIVRHSTELKLKITTDHEYV